MPLHPTRLVLVLAVALLSATPSASATFTSSLNGDRLALVQTANSGAVVIDNSGVGGAFRVIEGGTTTFVAANNLEVFLLNNSHPTVAIDLDNAVLRDVLVDLGKGDRQLNFTGTSNTIGGHLEILGQTGIQTVELAVNAALVIGGDLSIDLGVAFDTVDEDGRNITVAGDLNFTGVNSFENNGTMLVVGNARILAQFEDEPTDFDDDTSMSILGDFKFVGGGGKDQVQLNGTSTRICGSVDVDLRGATPGAGAQVVSLNVAGVRVGGDLIVHSGDSDVDVFNGNADLSVGGKIQIDLGEGTNTAAIEARCAGALISYKGGKGTDTVTLGVTARGSAVKINTSGDADLVTLNASTTVKKLTIDFGGGADSFSDLFVNPKPFKVKVKNLP